MRGRDKKPGRGKPFVSTHPLRAKAAAAVKPPATASGKAPAASLADDANAAPAAATAKPRAATPAGRPLDGEGKPYITLAQYLKWKDLAGTGGNAKALVRDGGILVNGTAENRPGRKLHTGDTVTVGGIDHPVMVEVDG